MSASVKDRERVSSPRAFAGALLGLIAAGAAAALVVLALPALGETLYPSAPRPSLAADPGTALALVAHNTPVALWPLCLVALGWQEIPLARRLGDGLIAAQLAVHGASVGAALAAWPELIRWLAHLPAEGAALALPCSAWTYARAGVAPPRCTLLVYAAVSAALLALAAVIETWAAPG